MGPKEGLRKTKVLQNRKGLVFRIQDSGFVTCDLSDSGMSSCDSSLSVF